MNDNQELLFMAVIADGYSFRNAISTILNEKDHVSMFLSKKTIEISCLNAKRYASHSIIINTDELTLYRYNAVNESGELEDWYSITFEVEEFFKAVKPLGRRDTVRLYAIQGGDNLYIQPLNNNTDDSTRLSSSTYVRIIYNEEASRDTIIDIGGPEPNVRIPARAFSNMCVQASTFKCTHLEIRYNNEEIVFQGIQSDKSVRFTTRYETGNKRKASENDMFDYAQLPLETPLFNSNQVDTSIICVPISTVKAISKIHNISPLGTQLRFYYESGKPIKITSPIGTYGTYILCLREPK